ncbi:MAG TPA: Bro-N domain-containing protein [Candidatus Nanoarchaeia archaeon]|nr:Bro-N domain-containing protein [Candidatus Nanoarchaeia archaeon]
MNKLSIFEGKKVRKIWHKDEWWFSVIDVVAILTDQSDYLTARKYWNKLSQRLREEGSEVVTNCHQLKLTAEDGKLRETDCANTEILFRLLQSIPSSKAEPFKLWLAKTGYERVQEIENPELAQKRMRELYRAKGYSDEWIEKRVRGIAIRDELTSEWEKRGVKTNKEYSILTAEISKATFGMTPGEYAKFKGLKTENLRDHMNDLELIFTMLGERVTTEITRTKDAQGFPENKDAAQEGGEVAGNARRDAENKIGKPISTNDNYLEEPEKKKRKQLS